MSDAREASGTAEDLIIASLFVRAEQTLLSHEPTHDEEAALRRFNAWLDDNVEEAKSRANPAEHTLRIARLRRVPMIFSSLDEIDDDEQSPQAETMAELPKYGFLKRLSDRWHALRDAQRGLPACSRKPKPTPTVEKLFDEFVTLVAAERERWDQEAAPLQERVAELTGNIKTTEEDLEKGHKLLDGWQQTTTNGTSDGEQEACRRRDTVRRPDKWDPLMDTKRQLTYYQAEREKLDEKIKNLDQRCLERQNQIAGYSDCRVQAYCAKLIRAHPHSDRLSMNIKWGLAELASALERSDIEELLIKIRKLRDTRPPEKD